MAATLPHTMPQTTFVLFLPTSAVLLPQEPKTAPDSPAPAPTPGSPQGPGTTQTPAGPQGSQGSPQSCAGGSEMLWYLPLFLALMYFMVMRPEQKRRKQQQALMSSMKVGDRVVTAGGMHGVVSKLADKTVTLRVDNTQMTFDRVAIARIERDDAPAAQPPKS